MTTYSASHGSKIKDTQAASPYHFCCISRQCSGKLELLKQAIQRNHLQNVMETIHRVSQKPWLLKQLIIGYHMHCREHSDAFPWLLSIGDDH